MKKRLNDSARASALQISVSVALLCFAAVLFASSFRAAAPAIATEKSAAANQPGFYPPLPNQAPNLTQYPRSQNAPEQAVGITAPTFSMDVSDGFVVNNQTVNASTISPSLNIIGCQGDLIFDSAVALPTPMTNPVNATGLTANNWTVSGNVIQTCNGVPCPGTFRTLRISAFSNDGVTPLDGAGPVYNIKWKRVSANSGDSTTLIWGTVESGNDFELIDTDLNVISASPQNNGLITITGPTPTPGGTATPTPVPTASPTPPPTASPTPMPTEPPTPTPPPIATPTPSPTASPTPVSTATPTPGGLPKVSAPTFNMDTSDGFAVNNQPVTVTNIDPGLNYIGFQGDLIFDSAVAAPTPSGAPVGAAGLTANNWTVSGNVLNSGPGTLRTIRVSAFSNDGVTPLNGAGILFQIHWKRVSTNSGDTTPLTWSPSPNDFEFIDTDLNVFSPPQNNGMITITGATPTPGGTATPTPEPTATPTPVSTATPTPEVTATPTQPPTATPTPQVTATPTSPPTATPTPQATATPTPVATATPSPEPTATPTPISTATPTAPPTATPTPASTASPTPEPTATATPGATQTPTATPAPTITPVPTATPQPTCKKGDIKFEGHSSTSGAPGNIRTFHKDGTFVKASGFSRDDSGAWSMSYLGLYDHGLGVTGPTEGNGDNNRFLVDNAGGSTDYVLFEFNTLINVDKVRLEKVLADSDISVWIGTTDDPFSNHNILSDAFLASLADNETNLGGHGDRDANINPGVVSGNVLVVAAKSGDTDDAFLIRKLNYDCPTTCPTITLDPPTLPDGTIGHNYNKDIHAHGGHGEDTFTLTGGSLPPGLTIDSHGHIRGEPTTEGTYNFTVTATDDRGCSGSHDYTLTIECPDINLNPGSLPNAKKNHSYNKMINANGGDSPYSFDLAGGSLPPGIDLSSDGRLTGSPTALGTFTFMVSATDENGCKGTKAYSLTVTN